MKRTPLKASSSRIRPNAKRKARLFARNFHSKAFVEWTKSQPCATCGELQFRDDKGCNVTSHVKSRGAGGTWTDTISQCVKCHREFEAAPESWPRLNGFDMTQLAMEHNARWRHWCEVRT